MSAQLLICKFAVLLVFTLFLPMACETCMSRWLAVCQDLCSTLQSYSYLMSGKVTKTDSIRKLSNFNF